MQPVFHIPPARVFVGSSVASFALALGCLFHGWLADRLGYAQALLLGAIGLLLGSYALYLDLRAGGTHFAPLYALAGFSVGVVGVVPALMVVAFPPAVRFTGLSFSYNVSCALFGGLTPPLIGPLAPAHCVALAALAGMAVALSQWRAQRTPPA